MNTADHIQHLLDQAKAHYHANDWRCLGERSRAIVAQRAGVELRGDWLQYSAQERVQLRSACYWWVQQLREWFLIADRLAARG